MNSISVETSDGRTAFEPGEEISVDLNWDFDQPPEAIELRLVWNSSGKGTTDVEVAQTERIDEPLGRNSRRITLTLPASPYSFSGKLVSIIWALEAVALPRETSSRFEIVIAPNRAEVQVPLAEPE